MRFKLVPFLAAAWVAGAALPAGADDSGTNGSNASNASNTSGPTTYYASPDGKDANPGTMDSPWRTIQRAKRVLKPGDALLLADGEYPGGVIFNTPGASGSPITFKAINPGRAILRGDQTHQDDVFMVREASWVVIDGLVLQNAARNGIYVAVSDHVTIRNCVSHDNAVTGILTGGCQDLLIENCECYNNSEQHGIYVSCGSDRPIVRYNSLHDNGRCGLQLNGDGRHTDPTDKRRDGIVDSAVIDSNILYGNGANGGGAINLACVRNSTVINNLIYNNKAGGISLFNDETRLHPEWGSKNNVIAANTIYFRPGEGRWCITFTHGSTDNTLQDNILMGGGRGAYAFDETCSFKADHNLLYNPKYPFLANDSDTEKMLTITAYQDLTGNDTHSVFADPKFRDPGGQTPDFHVKADSPAIQAGVAMQQVQADADGNNTPDTIAPDLGCFGGYSAKMGLAKPGGGSGGTSDPATNPGGDPHSGGGNPAPNPAPDPGPNPAPNPTPDPAPGPGGG